MMPVEGGYVRLDTRTGIASICSKRGEAWACEAMPDAQQEMRDVISRLEGENAKLKDELKQMEDTFGLSAPKPGGPDGGPLSPDAGPPAPKAQIPSEKDVDRMFDYIEGMVRKFKERIERLDKETPPAGKPEGAPGGEGGDGTNTPL